MSSRSKRKRLLLRETPVHLKASATMQAETVPSLLDAMEDGKEYGSIISRQQPGDLMLELQRALSEIEQARGRPCLCYAANVLKSFPETSISPADHLPFAEMVGAVPTDAKRVDIFLVTPGGLAEQVNLFVEALRPRFDEVDFLIPYKAMSAGTLWALSGNRIWMDERAFLGPIDPQIASSDGMNVPAQALVALLDRIQKEGQAALAKGQQPPWTYIQLLRHMDQRQLGAALSWSKYVVDIAAKYLETHKFRSWTVHETTKPGSPVTPEQRRERAFQVARDLASHEKWQAHGHAISREVLWRELHIKIDRPETSPELLRAMRRTWAMLYYLFEKGPVVKVICSPKYAMVRSQLNPAGTRKAP